MEGFDGDINGGFPFGVEIGVEAPEGKGVGGFLRDDDMGDDFFAEIAQERREIELIRPRLRGGDLKRLTIQLSFPALRPLVWRAARAPPAPCRRSSSITQVFRLFTSASYDSIMN